jgi:hypothetical protein
MISFNVLFFWISILFVFWLASLGEKQPVPKAAASSPNLTTSPAGRS